MIWLLDFHWWAHTTVGGYLSAWLGTIAFFVAFYGAIIAIDSLCRGVRGLFGRGS